MQIGKMYFFTATINGWRHVLQEDARKQIIIDSLRWLVDNKSVGVHAFVIMPNHIHLIWTLLPNPSVKNVQLSFMKFTGQKLLFHLKDHHQAIAETLWVGKKGRSYQIWQRNPLAIELYTRKVVEQKLDYVHNNPLQGKWMLATEPSRYPFSSASYYEENDFRYSFLTHYMDVL